MQVESLGRYVVEKELGRGAMGQVFLAYDPEIDRRVAIKTIQIFASLPESERAQARERFLREARSAGKLLHPGIVTIFDVGEADGVPYLAMEFIEGATLDTFCKEDTLLPVPVVIALIAAAADALRFAHQNGIVHRDIKPANLMRVSGRSIKVMDFGLAKDPATSMTHDGALLGTPNYMSPEQVRGESLDGRADLFALGIVCYELLTGTKPFSGDSISSVLYRIVNEPPKEAGEHADRMAGPLAKFMATALSKDPRARFQDGAAFAAALRKAGESYLDDSQATRRDNPDASPPGVPTESSVQRSRSRLPWLLGAVVVTLAAAAAILFSGRSDPPPAPTLSARVRTEPAGLPVRFNGEPLSGESVSFAALAPFGVLSAAHACREAKHRLEPGDAGRDIVLVLDPTRAEVTLDPGGAGARLTVNGGEVGTAPATIDLDLCRDNTISMGAPGFKTAVATIPAKATPLDARTAAAGLRLEALPTGRLVFPSRKLGGSVFVDGQLIEPTPEGIELPQGPHEIRITNEARFVDVRETVDVPAGGTAQPALAVPQLAGLTVQTFPPNCRASLKRLGSADWRILGETPLRYELAAGRYTLRVEAPVSGESREREIDLRAGSNAPVRVSFGRSDP